MKKLAISLVMGGLSVAAPASAGPIFDITGSYTGPDGDVMNILENDGRLSMRSRDEETGVRVHLKGRIHWYTAAEFTFDVAEHMEVEGANITMKLYGSGKYSWGDLKMGNCTVEVQFEDEAPTEDDCSGLWKKR